jgi:hypothetical protein
MAIPRIDRVLLGEQNELMDQGVRVLPQYAYMYIYDYFYDYLYRYLY